MTRTRAAVLTAAAVLGVVGLSACSAYTTKSGTASQPAPATTTRQAPEPAGANGTQLIAAQVGNRWGNEVTQHRVDKSHDRTKQASTQQYLDQAATRGLNFSGLLSVHRDGSIRVRMQLNRKAQCFFARFRM